MVMEHLMYHQIVIGLFAFLTKIGIVYHRIGSKVRILKIGLFAIERKNINQSIWFLLVSLFR